MVPFRDGARRRRRHPIGRRRNVEALVVVLLTGINNKLIVVNATSSTRSPPLFSPQPINPLAPRATLRPNTVIDAVLPRPKFDGWCCRCTHAEGAASFIVGVFRRGRTEEEHVAAVLVRNITGTFGAQRVFVKRVSCDEEMPVLTANGWSHPGVGTMTWGPDAFVFEADLAIDGVAASARVDLSSSSLLSDDHDRGAQRRASLGSAQGFDAEGWLGNLPFRLVLPCRYVVPLVGAPCVMGDFEKGGSEEGRTRGLAHVEFNAGRAFPSGWVWSQAHDVSTGASFLVVAGSLLRGIAGSTVLVCVRDPAASNEKEDHSARLDLRTVDLRTKLKRFVATRDSATETAVVDLELERRTRRVTTLVRIRLAAPVASFFETTSESGGDPLVVPTPRGFRPGAREAFDATAVVEVVETSKCKKKATSPPPLGDAAAAAAAGEDVAGGSASFVVSSSSSSSETTTTTITRRFAGAALEFGGDFMRDIFGDFGDDAAVDDEAESDT